MKASSQTTVTVKIDVGSISAFCHVTRQTTCYDVLQMVVNKKQTNKSYVLYESRDGVEMMVSPQTRLLKLIRSWGVEQGLYSLLVKPTCREKLKSKMASIAKARRKLRRMRSTIMAEEIDLDNKLKHRGGSSLTSKTPIDRVQELSPELPGRENCHRIDCSSFMTDLSSNLDHAFLSDNSSGYMDCLNESSIDNINASVAETSYESDARRNPLAYDVTSRSLVSRIKNIFKEGEAIAHDSAVDSFMKTLVGTEAFRDDLY